MSIDPRLLERRQTVAEDNAHRTFGRLLRFLVALVVAAGLVWLAFSPWLSVHRVRTEGIESSDGHATLAGNGVVAGTPMIMLRTGQVEEALEADPWVKRARVSLLWPNEVIVHVIERQPVLWVRSGEGWSWHAIDGVAVPGPDAPDEESPRLVADQLVAQDLSESRLVIGAAEFVDALPGALTTGVIVREEAGEVWATVSGYEVRLGRPVDMAAKALSLTALLREQLPPDAILILVAPNHPAVRLPAPAPEVGDITPDSGDREVTAASDRNADGQP